MIDMNQIPDLVLEALRDPSLQQSEKFKLWLEESKEHKDIFEELCAYQEAGKRLLPENEPNLDLQWNRIKSKRPNIKKSPSLILRFPVTQIMLFAACVIIIFLLNLYFEHIDTPEHSANETVDFITDLPAKKDAIIVMKTVNNVCPILLSTGQGVTTSVHKKLLDYTQDTTKITNERLTITTPRGRSINILLSDSTMVWLNAESRLSYPSYFSGSERMVELEGEAYFKVAHDKKHPFIVKHQETITRALGTEFNIRSYMNEKRHVTLVEGSVLVSDTLSSQKQILHPGQDAEYDSLSEITVKEVNTHEFTAWTKGLFYFEQTELLDIMQVLGRWYNVTVCFEDKDIQNYHFTFWAERNGSLKDALSLLNQIGTVRVLLNTDQKQVIVKKR